MNKVFIDLEGVLIDSWHTGNSIIEWTGEQISSLCEQYSVTEADLFSFAVDNAADEQSVLGWLPQMFKCLGIELGKIHTVQEIMDTVGFDDFMFVFKQKGKRRGFIEYVANICHLDEYEDVDNFVLLDDVVDDEVIDMGSYHITLRQIV